MSEGARFVMETERTVPVGGERYGDSRRQDECWHKTITVLVYLDAPTFKGAETRARALVEELSSRADLTAHLGCFTDRGGCIMGECDGRHYGGVRSGDIVLPNSRITAEYAFDVVVDTDDEARRIGRRIAAQLGSTVKLTRRAASNAPLNARILGEPEVIEP